jgi:hypothetical protein
MWQRREEARRHGRPKGGGAARTFQGSNHDCEVTMLGSRGWGSCARVGVAFLFIAAVGAPGGEMSLVAHQTDVADVAIIGAAAPSGPRRRQQDAAEDAVRAAAPPWLETRGFECHPNTRWELQGVTNGKAAWTTSSEGRQWFLYHRPGNHHYWAIDSADDDSSAPVGKTDPGGEDGGPVPRSSNVADDTHTAWTENCDDPILGNDWSHGSHHGSNHDVTIRAPLTPANCEAIAEQAAVMPGCGAIAGGGKGGCSGCEHPWIATAVLHPVMWPDASACAWAAVCTEEALQEWAARFPDALALRLIRDAQPPAARVPGCLGDWVDFTDPCPTWGDNTLLGGWPGVLCNGTRVVGLGVVRLGPQYVWPAEFCPDSSSEDCVSPTLLDANPDRIDRDHVARLFHSKSGLQDCGLVALPAEALPDMTELRYINVQYNGLKGLPSTICDARALSTLELLSNPVQSIPDCLCDSNIVRTMSLTAELLRNQPDCLARSITTLSAQRGNLREVPARVGELVELIVSPACIAVPTCLGIADDAKETASAS